jgi:hypothetical protein
MFKDGIIFYSYWRTFHKHYDCKYLLLSIFLFFFNIFESITNDRQNILTKIRMTHLLLNHN